MSGIGQVAAAAPTYVAGDWVGLRITTAGELVTIGSAAGGATVITGNHTPSDNYANPTDAVDALCFMMGWDGATWDRITSTTQAATIIQALGLSTVSAVYGRNPYSGLLSIMPTLVPTADDLDCGGDGVPVMLAWNMAYNAATSGWDRIAAKSKQLRTADDYGGFQALAEQTGAAAKLTFTFAQAVDLILVESSGAGLQCRVTLDGTDPTAVLGIRVTDESKYIPGIGGTAIEIYAPTGAVVNVCGWFRA